MPSHHHHAAAAAETDDAAMAELLDFDAEVLHSYLSEVTAWIRELAADPPPHHRVLDIRDILDLGSGTGTGTFALLERFEQANAVAVDVSAQLLHHLTGKARDLGRGDRVRTVQADLDAAWPALDAVDLVWASASLHHMTDPDHVLAQVFGTLRPGGFVVVAEMDAFPRFLPDDLGVGQAGLEERCHAALAEGRIAGVPHLGSDWGLRLSHAGFTIEAERRFAINLTSPLPTSAGRYAQSSLRRIRSSLDGRVDPGDLATLDILLDSDGPDGILRRDDLTVRTARTVWVARRP